MGTFNEFLNKLQSDEVFAAKVSAAAEAKHAAGGTEGLALFSLIGLFSVTVSLIHAK